jgi:CheY-like chemotaxis protein
MANQKVLLIDNDEEDQEIFCAALQDVDASISCTMANNAVNALEKINTDPEFTPTIIFIDMNMPMINGLECLQKLKTIERLRDIPVYIYSTSASPSTIADAKRLGAIDFVVKPVGFSQLTALLTDLLVR